MIKTCLVHNGGWKKDRKLTFVSGDRASCFKEPVEGSFRVLSDGKEVWRLKLQQKKPQNKAKLISFISTFGIMKLLFRFHRKQVFAGPFLTFILLKKTRFDVSELQQETSCAAVRGSDRNHKSRQTTEVDQYLLQSGAHGV